METDAILLENIAQKIDAAFAANPEWGDTMSELLPDGRPNPLRRQRIELVKTLQHSRYPQVSLDYALTWLELPPSKREVLQVGMFGGIERTIYCLECFNHKEIRFVGENPTIMRTVPNKKAMEAIPDREAYLAKLKELGGGRIFLCDDTEQSDYPNKTPEHMLYANNLLGQFLELAFGMDKFYTDENGLSRIRYDVPVYKLTGLDSAAAYMLIDSLGHAGLARMEKAYWEFVAHVVGPYAEKTAHLPNSLWEVVLKEAGD